MRGIQGACGALCGLVLFFHSGFLHADPPAEGKWQTIPELSDEFEGDTLDARKWWDHNPGWNGRQPGYFSGNNVSVRGGRLQLTARVENLKDLPEGYHTFTTAAVKSKGRILYGYFEIKCRPMKSKASSGFWFYHDEETRWTEIDVFEICGAGDARRSKYHMDAHVFPKKGYQETKLSNPGVWEAPFVFANDYHVYSLEWDRNVIRWRVDGKVVRELRNDHWHQPLHMNLDSETMPDWFGLPDKMELPATFSIEYVRSWRTLNDAKHPVSNTSSKRRSG